MRLVLMGAPGAGKGTQADVMARKLFVPHVSTGEIFRAAINAGTDLGMLANSYMSKGLLVPDHVTMDIVKDRLSQPDCAAGFILDGLPRTLAQAEALEEILVANNTPLDFVINIAVNTDNLIQRLSGRRVCRSCPATYHMLYNPPSKPDICDECGATLYQRNDDSEATIKNRLEVYAQTAQPLLDYYQAKGILFEVDGEQSIHLVFAAVGKGLGRDWE